MLDHAMEDFNHIFDRRKLFGNSRLVLRSARPARRLKDDRDHGVVGKWLDDARGDVAG